MTPLMYSPKLIFLIIPLLVVLALVSIACGVAGTEDQMELENTAIPTASWTLPALEDCAALFVGEDPVRAATIADTDPSALTDAERFAWSSSVGTPYECIALWSAPVIEENAEKRNNQFSACLDGVKRRIEEAQSRSGAWGYLTTTAHWQDVATLLQRPYLSLAESERLWLRDALHDIENNTKQCSRYYPQLYTGRWIPILMPTAAP